MTNEDEETSAARREPHRVRLPGFITDEDVGLGDVIKKATSIVGIRPCGGCAQRATTAKQLDGLHQPAVNDDEGKQTVEQIELAQQPTPRPTARTCCGWCSTRAQGVDSTAAPSFVYALGRVDARFPSLAVEKEFHQVTGRTNTAGQTDRQALHSVLSGTGESLPGPANVLCVHDRGPRDLHLGAPRSRGF